MADDDTEFEDAMRGMGLRAGARITTPEEARPAGATAPEAHGRQGIGGGDPGDASEFLSAMASLEVGSVPTDEAAPRDRDPNARVKALTVGTARTLQRRIRHGEIGAERELDLHGLRRAEARSATLLFVRRCAADGLKVVRVVSGRGLHSRERAVLQEALGGWVREDLVEAVRDVVPAPATMGGRGVLYLFLR